MQKAISMEEIQGKDYEDMEEINQLKLKSSLSE